jgi:AP-4 complex subunit epsilon-1
VATAFAPSSKSFVSPQGGNTGLTVCTYYIFEVTQAHLKASALLLGSFRVLAAIPEADLPPTADLAGRRSPAHALRPLLASDAPNDHYLFLSCLSLLLPRLWSGIDPELPPVLDGSEVGRVMTFLDARDGLIRRKVRAMFLFLELSLISFRQTLAVLHAVDPSIVNGYRSRLFQARPVPSEGDQWNSYVERLLEVACAASVEDGATYTDLVVETLDALDGMDAMHAPVQEQAVSMVLTHLRNGTAVCLRFQDVD